MGDATAIWDLALRGIGTLAVAGLIVSALYLVFLKSFVQRLARQSLDKELESYKQTLKNDAAMIRLAHQKEFREFDLYTEARHRIYAEMYARLRDVDLAVGRLWESGERPTYSGWTAKEVQRLLMKRRVRKAPTAEILRTWDSDNGAATKRLIDELWQSDCERALRALKSARIFKLRNELYFSLKVRHAVVETIDAAYRLREEIIFRRSLPPGYDSRMAIDDPDGAEKLARLHQSIVLVSVVRKNVERVLGEMRAELHREEQTELLTDQENPAAVLVPAALTTDSPAGTSKRSKPRTTK